MKHFYKFIKYYSIRKIFIILNAQSVIRVFSTTKLLMFFYVSLGLESLVLILLLVTYKIIYNYNKYKNIVVCINIFIYN